MCIRDRPCILCKHARKRKTKTNRVYYSCNTESRGEIKGQVVTEWVDRPDDYGLNDFIGCEDAIPKDNAVKRVL